MTENWHSDVNLVLNIQLPTIQSISEYEIKS